MVQSTSFNVRSITINYNAKISTKSITSFLPALARVRVPPEYLQKVTWDDSLPLSYLIPTLTGSGVCTVALVDLLVGAHNEFIEKCHSELKKKQNTE